MIRLSRHHRTRNSVTIFLALIFTCTAALICALSESARTA